MPLYEYECAACGHRFEVIQKFSNPPPDACPKCGGGVRKLPSSPAIQFKGTGWYITDYGRKPEGGAAKSEGKSEKTSEESKPAGDAKPAETKTPTTTSSGPAKTGE